MKFLADMGISPKTVIYLNDLGYDAIHLTDEGLFTMSDPDILIKARHENRVLLTHDLDFGELMAASGKNLPSVIIFRLKNMHPEQVNHYLQQIIPTHHEQLEKGAIISVTNRRARVRSLPI